MGRLKVDGAEWVLCWLSLGRAQTVVRGHFSARLHFLPFVTVKHAHTHTHTHTPRLLTLLGAPSGDVMEVNRENKAETKGENREMVRRVRSDDPRQAAEVAPHHDDSSLMKTPACLL